MKHKENPKNGQNLISLDQAREILRGIAPLSLENIPLSESVGRVAADDIYAVSDCPSVDSSLKDGYAVVADDICRAVPDSPVELDVLSTVTAGQDEGGHLVRPGTAVRIMTGAGVPEGADAVLTSEFANERHGKVSAFRDAHPGRNILKHGSDVRAGAKVVKAGTELAPTHLGLLAAAGVSSVVVHCLPRIVVVATGSELVPPGTVIEPGKVAASNMITL
ncbi:MAG: molybdopterin molybdenumtransferase MoeA, partial [Desulfobulbaceae bacterium]|nr:molybdopterin molybdenumtransferase MoeA [Desulfobulbaceae bacterium]